MGYGYWTRDSFVNYSRARGRAVDTAGNLDGSRLERFGGPCRRIGSHNGVLREHQLAGTFRAADAVPPALDGQVHIADQQAGVCIQENSLAVFAL